MGQQTRLKPASPTWKQVGVDLDWHLLFDSTRHTCAIVAALERASPQRAKYACCGQTLEFQLGPIRYEERNAEVSMDMGFGGEEFGVNLVAVNARMCLRLLDVPFGNTTDLLVRLYSSMLVSPLSPLLFVSSS